MKGSRIVCPVCKTRYDVNDRVALALHQDCAIRALPTVDFEAAYWEEKIDEMAGYPLSKHLWLSDTRTGRTRLLTAALRRLLCRGLVE